MTQQKIPDLEERNVNEIEEKVIPNWMIKLESIIENKAKIKEVSV